MHRLLVLLLLALVLFTGCKTRTQITFNEDGSGTFTSSLELDDRELRLLSEQGDPIEQLVANAESVSFPVDVERTETGNTQGFIATFRFSDIEDMKAKLAELNQEGDSSSTLFKDAQISEDDDGWTFVAQSGVAAPEGSEEFIDPEELSKLIDAHVQVTMPGPEGENNATTVEGSEESTTFVWQINPGTEIELRAATVFPDTLWDKLLSPIGLAIAAVVVALIVFLVLRMRKARAG